MRAVAPTTSATMAGNARLRLASSSTWAAANPPTWISTSSRPSMPRWPLARIARTTSVPVATDAVSVSTTSMSAVRPSAET